MKILLVEPCKELTVTEISGELNEMQKIVGGNIQGTYPFGDEVALVCNDDGKLMGLTPNRALRDDNGHVYDIIFGTFFLCGAHCSNDRFSDLTEDQIEHYKNLFASPEMFVEAFGKVICITIA